MRFKTYVTKNYINNKDNKGRFAQVIKSKGKWFPVRISHDVYRRYLENYCETDDDILAAFEECFKEWKELEQKKK